MACSDWLSRQPNLGASLLSGSVRIGLISTGLEKLQRGATVGQPQNAAPQFEGDSSPD